MRYAQGVSRSDFMDYVGLLQGLCKCTVQGYYLKMTNKQNNGTRMGRWDEVGASGLEARQAYYEPE